MTGLDPSLGTLARRLATCLLTLHLLAAAAIAQEAGSQPAPTGEEPPIRLNLKDLGIPGFGGASTSEADPATVSASFKVIEGSRRGTLSVRAEMAEGWHVYSLTQPSGGALATKIKVPEVVDFRLLGPFQPDRQPHVRKPGDNNPFPVNVEEHDEQVTWSAPIELTEGVKPEGLEIAVEVFYQVCKHECLTKEKKLTARFAGYEQPPTNLGEYRPDPRFEAEVVLSGHLEPAAVVPGGKARLVITAKPTPGWHIYAYSPIDPDQVSKP